MSNIVLGINVSKKELNLVLLIGEKPFYKTGSNDLKGFKCIIYFVKKFVNSSEVYLEATGRYGEAVTDFLHVNGFDVKVINPMQISAFSKLKLSRNKTDKTDAGIIAEYDYRCGGISYTPIAENIKELRELYRASLSLKEELTVSRNHMENKEPPAKLIKDLWKQRVKDLENDIKNIEKSMM